MSRINIPEKRAIDQLSFEGQVLSNGIDFLYNGGGDGTFLRIGHIVILDEGESFKTNRFTIHHTDADTLPYLKAALISEYVEDGELRLET